MLDLADIPFFAALTSATLERIRPDIPLRRHARGDVILRMGEHGRAIQAIAAGAVRVQTDGDVRGGGRTYMLGPGEIFGEMSLFTGMPVAATLVAARDTLTYAVDGDTFLRLIDEEPALHRSLTTLLIERLRQRARADASGPRIVVLAVPDLRPAITRFACVLQTGIGHYAPGVDSLGIDGVGSDTPDVPDAGALVRWRAQTAGEHYLVIAALRTHVPALASVLTSDDIVLDVGPADALTAAARDDTHVAGAAEWCRVNLGTRPRGATGPWEFALDDAELARAESAPPWQRQRYRALDHLVRYVTFREIGIALSSGAARGFAHLGALEVLEAHGIPLDVLCGTSMGGITALSVASVRSVAEGAAKMREFLGGNRKIRDTSWWPRASLFAGSKIARAAEAMFAGTTFADLRMPALVVASDLAAGAPVTLDRGPVAPAVLGTSAIPGLFPPIAHGDRLLVDGAIVSRVPVDVLARRRCGIRIAVNVVPNPGDDAAGRGARLAALRARMQRPFGFKHAVGAAWELLGSHGSSMEALHADVVITPEAHRHGAAFDFDRFESMIACGREAMRSRIEAVETLVDTMLKGSSRASR